MKVQSTCLILALSSAFAMNVNAAVVVTDNGTTTPTGLATGHTILDPRDVDGNPRVFGARLGNEHGQTFQTGAGTMDTIWIAYDGALSGAATATDFTLTVDIGNDATDDLTETFTLGAGGTSITQGGAGSQLYWLAMDVSSNNLAVTTGTHSFNLTVDQTNGGTTNTTDWYIAPAYTTGVDYPLGVGNGIGAGQGDANFAVSGPAAVPEPASLILLVLSGLAALVFRMRC